jgi:hypothetical protein
MNQELKIKCKVIKDYPLVKPERLPGIKQYFSIQPVDEEIPVFITGQGVQFYFNGGMFVVNIEMANKLLELLVESKTIPIIRDGKRGIMVFHEIDEERSTLECTHFKQ